MFKKLLSLGRRPNRAVIDALYAEIVASARQPAFYSDLGVPDTPLGRFEMLSVHIFLFLERARGGAGTLADVAQDLTDEFFKDVEHSLRELGIGDMGVPKRMKRLAKMFYGRAEAYREALDAGDQNALAAALARNVCPGQADWSGAGPLAQYVRQALEVLKTLPESDMLDGRIRFPAFADTVGEGGA